MHVCEQHMSRPSRLDSTSAQQRIALMLESSMHVWTAAVCSGGPGGFMLLMWPLSHSVDVQISVF